MRRIRDELRARALREAETASAGTTPTTQAFGDTADPGTSEEYSTIGHKHGMPANPVTAHVLESDPHTGYRLESEKMASIADSTGAGDVVEQLNLLLAALRDGGYMEPLP